MMLIIGLTGSMGMGKSTAAAHFKARGIPVFSSDEAVHELYAGQLVARIADAFPGIVSEGRVDRRALSAHLARHPQDLKKLEAMVHPLVRDRQWDFLKQAEADGARFAVLEIPLLFEVGIDQLVDVTIVLTAPEEVQRTRVFERPGMTEEKFKQLLGRQLPDKDKRERADFVVDTDRPIEETARNLRDVMDKIGNRQPQAFDKWRALYQDRG